MKKKIKFKGAMRRYLRWPLFLTAILVLFTILIFQVSWQAGLISTAGTLFYVLCTLLVFKRYSPLIMNDLVSFAQQYGELQKDMFNELEVPYAIMDEKGRLIWSNTRFMQLTGKDSLSSCNIERIFPEIMQENIQSCALNQKSEMTVYRDNQIFRAVLQKMSLQQMEQM